MMGKEIHIKNAMQTKAQRAADKKQTKRDAEKGKRKSVYH